MTERTHCKSGKHAWIPENIYTPPRSYSARNTPALTCKLCARDTALRHKRRVSARFPTTGNQRKPHDPQTRIERYEEWVEIGLSFERIAANFGIKPTSLQRFLERYEMEVPKWRGSH